MSETTGATSGAIQTTTSAVDTTGSDLTEKTCTIISPFSVGLGALGLPFIGSGLFILVFMVASKSYSGLWIPAILILPPVLLMMLPFICKKHPKIVIPLLIVSVCVIIYLFRKFQLFNNAARVDRQELIEKEPQTIKDTPQ